MVSDPVSVPASSDAPGHDFSEKAVDLLFALLREVVRRHHPELLNVLSGGTSGAGLSPQMLGRAIQAQGLRQLAGA